MHNTVQHGHKREHNKHLTNTYSQCGASLYNIYTCLTVVYWVFCGLVTYLEDRDTRITDTTLHLTLYFLHFAVTGEDYTLNSPYLTYSAGGPNEACTNITILNDDILEGYHNFSVEVVSSSVNTTIIPTIPLVIQIQDDDRKC